MTCVESVFKRKYPALIRLIAQRDLLSGCTGNSAIIKNGG